MFPRVRLSPTAVNRCQRLSRTTIPSPQKDPVLSSLPLSRINAFHGMSSVSTHELALTPGVLFLHCRSRAAVPTVAHEGASLLYQTALTDATFKHVAEAKCRGPDHPKT